MAISGTQIGAGIGAAGDLFQGVAGFMGAGATASAYKKAAKFAKQNARISREAGDIRLAQESRQIFKVLGAQQAGYAAAGLTGGGSAQSILRDSISQGALEKAIINAQTLINVNAYKSQAAQFKGMAKAAKAGGIGDLIGGIASAGASIAMIASDRRLKTDIERVGSHGLLGLYRYRYLNHDEYHVGPMADEVAIHYPHALGPTIDGYMTVDYGKLGLTHLLRREG